MLIRLPASHQACQQHTLACALRLIFRVSQALARPLVRNDKREETGGARGDEMEPVTEAEGPNLERAMKLGEKPRMHRIPDGPRPWYSGFSRTPRVGVRRHCSSHEHSFSHLASHKPRPNS